MRLLTYEVNELLDHLRSRPDIWHEGENLVFVRTDTQGTTCLGLKLTKPAAATTYAQWGVHVLPAAWGAADSLTYLDQLATKWTSYSLRRRFFAFLVNEVKLDTKKAEVVAIILSVMVCEADPEPEEQWQPPLPDIVPDRSPIIRDANRLEQTYMLQRGGWALVRLMGAQFSCELSLPNETGGGHTHMTGWVRSQRAAEARSVAEGLFGWPMKDPEQVVNPEAKQRYLGLGNRTEPE